MQALLVKILTSISFILQFQKEKNEEAQEDEGEKEVEDEEEEGEGEGEKEIKEVKLGPKVFTSSENMFDYFFKLLHNWGPNLDINQVIFCSLLFVCL